MDNQPAEILTLILKYLDYFDHFRCRSVCKIFKKLIDRQEISGPEPSNIVELILNDNIYYLRHHIKNLDKSISSIAPINNKLLNITIGQVMREFHENYVFESKIYWQIYHVYDRIKYQNRFSIINFIIEYAMYSNNISYLQKYNLIYKNNLEYILSCASIYGQIDFIKNILNNHIVKSYNIYSSMIILASGYNGPYFYAEDFFIIKHDRNIMLHNKTLIIEYILENYVDSSEQISLLNWALTHNSINILTIMNKFGMINKNFNLIKLDDIKLSIIKFLINNNSCDITNLFYEKIKSSDIICVEYLLLNKHKLIIDIDKIIKIKKSDAVIELLVEHNIISNIKSKNIWIFIGLIFVFASLF